MPYEEFSDRDRERIIKAHDAFLKTMVCDLCSLADVFGVSRDDLFDRTAVILSTFCEIGGSWQRFDIESARETIWDNKGSRKKKSVRDV